jgi:murein L,D-transpeptidase YcbB/YkuD
MKSITIFALLILSSLLSPWLAVGDYRPHPAAVLLRHWFQPLAREDAQGSVDPRSRPLAALARFYRFRGYRPSWIGEKGPLPQTKILLQAIRSAPEDGLPLMSYRLDDTPIDLSRRVLFSNNDLSAFDYDLARLDVALTAVMLKYAAHLSQGCIRPEKLSEALPFHDAHSIRDIPGGLARSLNEHRLARFLESLIPHHRDYGELKNALKRYRRIQAAGGWTRINAGATLRVNVQDARIETLRRHLVITGDLPTETRTDGDRFDPALEAAVKRYQSRHGLAADGAVGPETLEALNIPVEDRIIQLMLNMERWRWFPDNLGSRYIMVNIPGFELELVDDQAVVLSMRAIVGRKSRPTPILTSRMTYLELNPYWNIPQKIARQDILPKIQDDPEYLSRNGIRVFDSWQEDAPPLDPLGIDWAGLSENHFPYRLRQQPAGKNALGRIKFIFPNRQSVYIHDTPGKSLFSRSQRLFSSGCIRVEDPLELAQYLLKDQRWNRRKLALAVEKGQNRTIVLQTPVPVHLVYFTAWADIDGRVQFRDDVYGRDHRLLLDFLNAQADFHLCGAKDPQKINLAF